MKNYIWICSIISAVLVLCFITGCNDNSVYFDQPVAIKDDNLTNKGDTNLVVKYLGQNQYAYRGKILNIYELSSEQTMRTYREKGVRIHIITDLKMEAQDWQNLKRTWEELGYKNISLMYPK